MIPRLYSLVGALAGPDDGQTKIEKVTANEDAYDETAIAFRKVLDGQPRTGHVDDGPRNPLEGPAVTVPAEVPRAR